MEQTLTPQQKDKLHFNIAKLIASPQAFISEHATYENLLEAIFENRYRCIDKCPADTFIYGVINSFKPGVCTLEDVKDVVREALEFGGFELTFPDKDWDNLQLIKSEDRWQTDTLNTEKTYMSQFFEE